VVDPTVLASLGVGAILLFLVIYFLMNPEKVEIWSGLIARMLSNLGRLFKGAHKHYVKFDTQGRINEFTRQLTKEAPYLGATRCRVEWEDGRLDKRAFLENEQVILRLRRDDPEDLNFVHGAYHFVSTALLHKVKRYISQSHRESIDLFVTTNLLQAEKPAVVGIFLDAYLHPATGDPGSKVTGFFDQFSRIDKGGLFFTVLLQELDLLGGKVFGARRDDQVIIEVNELVDFLEAFAGRVIGEEGDLNFDKTLCRFGLVIVGKTERVERSGPDPYVAYINKALVPAGIETIYLLGSSGRADVMAEIADSLDETYDVIRNVRYKAVLNTREGLERESNQAVFVLRLRGAPVFQPSR
jgi:hypothetical protein